MLGVLSQGQSLCLGGTLHLGDADREEGLCLGESPHFGDAEWGVGPIPGSPVNHVSLFCEGTGHALPFCGDGFRGTHGCMRGVMRADEAHWVPSSSLVGQISGGHLSGQ